MWREPIMRPIARDSTAPRGSGAVAASGRVHRDLGSGAVLRSCPVGLRAGAMDPGAGRRATARPREPSSRDPPAGRRSSRRPLASPARPGEDGLRYGTCGSTRAASMT